MRIDPITMAAAGTALLLVACGNGGLPATATADPASAAGTSTESDRAVAAIDSVVGEILATGHVPGMAVAVVQRSDTLALRGYGYADLERRVSMTAQTVLPFGSILKQFTAAAVLRLAEQGELRLQDSIGHFFPDSPREWRAVTVHHLLNHTSGLPRSLAPGWANRERSRREDIVQELFERGALEFQPGERWVYNNAAYVMLALIIEQRTGEAYHDHISRTILEPLGMSSTGSSDAIPPRLPIALGYDTVQGGVESREFGGNVAALGSGFYHASVGDLVAWLQALHGGRLLRPDSYARMTAPTVLRSGEAWPYGYGVWLRELVGRSSIAHGGIQAGFRPWVGYLPAEELTVVVLINSGAVDSWAVGEAILRAVLAAKSSGSLPER